MFSEMLALLLLVLVQTSWSQFQEHPRPITATAGDGQPVKLGQWHQAKKIMIMQIYQSYKYEAVSD